jgi:hypothetical protein
VFHLDAPPERIEVYDNSHIQGAAPIGAMIVAGPDGFIKNSYRKFNIKTEGAAGDDFAMMREVLSRRFGRALKENPERDEEHWPDLVLIDGGQGQLEVARQVLTELGLEDIAIVGIAKGPDRDAGRERFFVPASRPSRSSRAIRCSISCSAARRGASLRHRHPSHAPRPPTSPARRSTRCRASARRRKRALLHISAAPARSVRRRSRTSSRWPESPMRWRRRFMTISAAAESCRQDMLNTANILTLSRIAGDPAGRGLLLARSRWSQWLSMGPVPSPPAVTDYFDGYFSRGAIIRSRGSAVSSIRSPDKLLVAAALLMLVDAGRCSGITCWPR